MNGSLLALALSLAVLQTARAAGNGSDAGSLWAAAQDLGAVVKAQAVQTKAAAEQKEAPAQKSSPAVVYTSKDPSNRVAGAGKGLRTEEFPIDPKLAELSSYAQKISFEQPESFKDDHSWRRNTWGVCRAWLTCNSGRQISCWAEGYNCDSYSNSGNHANVFCTAWNNPDDYSSSWDTCP